MNNKPLPRSVGYVIVAAITMVATTWLYTSSTNVSQDKVTSERMDAKLHVWLPINVICVDGVEYLLANVQSNAQSITVHLHPDGKPYACSPNTSQVIREQQ